jgi:tetrahydromethanopterin S-methyltransferase subunit B
MWEDPIVKETRAAREELLQRFNYDVDALCEYLQQLEAQSDKKAVTLEPRRPTSQRKVS